MTETVPDDDDGDFGDEGAGPDPEENDDNGGEAAHAVV